MTSLDTTKLIVAENIKLHDCIFTVHVSCNRNTTQFSENSDRTAIMYILIYVHICQFAKASISEPSHGKTNDLQMRNQRRRSASRLPRS